jgi:hypothetical protein
MATMRTVQVRKPVGGLELVTKEIFVPQASEVLIKMAACGICHDDCVTRYMPNIQYPRVTGHQASIWSLRHLGCKLGYRRAAALSRGKLRAFVGLVAPTAHPMPVMPTTFECMVFNIHSVPQRMVMYCTALRAAPIPTGSQAG